MYLLKLRFLFCLIAVAIAIPLLPYDPNRHPITIDQADNLTSNISLFDGEWSPLGPADLVTSLHEGPKAADPEECLGLVLGIVIAQAAFTD